MRVDPLLLHIKSDAKESDEKLLENKCKQGAPLNWAFTDYKC